ncbi:hypothetical protein ACW23B_00845 [Streptomyces albidoflavus]
MQVLGGPPQRVQEPVRHGGGRAEQQLRLADGAVELARLEGLAELGPLDLADLRLRDRLGLDGDQERGAHPDLPGDLAGDLPERTGRVLAGGQTEEERQFVGGGRRVGPDGDGGRETPDDAGQFLDAGLDLVAVVVDAVDDDDVLGASGDVQLAVAQERQVAGVEPAVLGERLGVGPRVVVVAVCHRGPADLEPAHVALREERVLVVDDAHGESG